MSKYLTNPSPEHQKAIEHLIDYLTSTRSYALRFGPAVTDIALQAYGDASFGNNEDRTSTSGYGVQLFGNTIDWRTHKQDRVTSSTTEAELYAMEYAARELMWWKRLLGQISITLGDISMLTGDNLQTVKLLTADTPQLTTRLRHVDITHHWLRQGFKQQDFDINWVSTNHMLADGLHKSLTSSEARRLDQKGWYH